MPALPDLHVLDMTAANLESHAIELRRRCQNLRAIGDTLHWQGGAANEFRHRNELVCTNGLRSAEQLDHAAAVLRRHLAAARDIVSIGEQILGGVRSVIGI